MVVLTSFAESDVMEGGRRIQHVPVNIVILSQGLALLHDRAGMISSVGFVEVVVKRQDFRLYVCPKTDVAAHFLSCIIS